MDISPSTSLRRRKLYAILAGGLVLGVGAAMSLAAWNDSEFATGTFTAGEFNLQGSTDGSTWTDHASEDNAATLSFSANFDNLSPDDVVYAPYALQLDATSNATLTTTAPEVTGALASDLSFAAVATTAFGCDATAFAEGSAVPTTIDDGETINLCLQVTADDNFTQGATATAVWQWTATSE